MCRYENSVWTPCTSLSCTATKPEGQPSAPTNPRNVSQSSGPSAAYPKVRGPRAPSTTLVAGSTKPSSVKNKDKSKIAKLKKEEDDDEDEVTEADRKKNQGDSDSEEKQRSRKAIKTGYDVEDDDEIKVFKKFMRNPSDEKKLDVIRDIMKRDVNYKNHQALKQRSRAASEYAKKR